MYQLIDDRYIETQMIHVIDDRELNRLLINIDG